jgi:nitrogen regulatory protein PII-like uncharacterized protein
MSSVVQERADAANDSYQNRSQSQVGNKTVELDGQRYQVFGYANDPITGFHATAYQQVGAPHDVIIAYRGTDPGLFSGKTNAEKADHALTTVQDIAVDATMVRDTVNPQKSAADAFTAEMIDKAAKLGIPKDHVTVAGHSLGGTLAEIEAAKYGLAGSTYNAYGAQGLTDGPPQPGTQLTNYRMAGDVVSAANPHIGDVVSLASDKDVQSMRDGRYLDPPAGAPPPNPLIAMRLGDHGGQEHFASTSPDNLLAPGSYKDATQLYKDNHLAFDHFISDVTSERGELAQALKQMQDPHGQSSLPPDLQRQVNEYLALNADQPVRNTIQQSSIAQGTENALQQGADAARASGHYVQTQDERFGQVARDVGNTMWPVNPAAPLFGAVVSEAAHLQGQAADATGHFVGDQLQSAKGAVEQGTHNVAEAVVGAMHNPGVQAAAANVVNHIVDTYHDAKATGQAVVQTYEDTKQTVRQDIHAVEHAGHQAAVNAYHDVQAAGHAVAQTYEDTKQSVKQNINAAEQAAGQAAANAYHNVQAAGHAVAQTYEDTKQSVKQDINAAEQAAGQAYDRLTHPGQWFGQTAAPAAPSAGGPHPQTQAVTPTDPGYSRNDPRNPDNPHHGLYKELQERVPKASENRLLQFTDACVAKGISEKNLGEIAFDRQGGHMVFHPSSTGPVAAVDVKQPSPEPAQSIQHIQQTDHQQATIQNQIQTQNAQARQQQPQGQTPGGLGF